MKQFILFAFTYSLSIFASAQSVKILTTGTKTSIRGLSVVNDSVIWASGSSGKIARSTNGGETFTWTTVKGFEKTEFRDIEAFDKNKAVIIAIDSPAIILRTVDGGMNWQPVYRNDTKGMFLDAMDFFDSNNGVVIGDPVDGRFFLAATKDGGATWSEMPASQRPIALNGEACFASSGTNIRATKSLPVFISGGTASAYFSGGNRTTLPLLQGKESTGANSVALKNKKHIIVVGGDFAAKDSVKETVPYPMMADVSGMFQVFRLPAIVAALNISQVVHG